MVKFNSHEDKEKVMNNLHHLKGIDDFKRIRITEDYTYTEQELIKEFRQQAWRKNQDEETDMGFIWVVRGDPKNGLTLKKLKKKSKAWVNW